MPVTGIFFFPADVFKRLFFQAYLKLGLCGKELTQINFLRKLHNFRLLCDEGMKIFQRAVATEKV